MGTITTRKNQDGTTTYGVKCRRKGFRSINRTFHNLKDAKTFERATEAAFDRGDMPAHQARPSNDAPARTSSAATLADCLRRYSDTVSPNHRGGQIEQMQIGRWLRECREFTSLPVDQLNASNVAAWRDTQLEGRAGSSVARQMNLMLGVINLARAEWGCDIPAIKVARPKSPPHRDRVLTAKEGALLLDGARDAQNPHLAPAIEFALATAMRAGEIIGLRWSDIDFSRRIARLHMTKNGTARDVPLSSTALDVLDGLERAEERVFVRLTSDTLKRQFARLVKRCKISDLHFHDLRHTSITCYARAGLNPLQLAVISGHKDTRMLQRYAHLKADDLVAIMG